MPEAIFNPMQPFINLVQALSKYAPSPDAMSKAMVQWQAAMTQGPSAVTSRLIWTPDAHMATRVLGRSPERTDPARVTLWNILSAGCVAQP